MIKWLLMITVLGAGSGWWFMQQETASAGSTMPEALIYEVQRQNLSIGTVESGQLQAVKSHKITSERGKIKWIIKEGEEVREGDRLMVLETKETEEQLKKVDENIVKQKDELDFLVRNTGTEESIAQSIIDDALLKLDQAREALRKYKQVDSIKKSNDLDKRVEEAERNLEQAAQEWDDKQRELDESVFVEAGKRERLEKEYAAAEKKLSNVQRQIEAAVNEKALFKSRTYPKEIERLQRALERAELEVEKEQGRARKGLIQHNNKIASIEQQIKRLEKQKEHHQKSLDHSVISAPVDGVVIYGDPGRGNWIKRELKVGGTAYSGYTLMTIPDMSRFSVQMPVSEHARGRVAVGCEAQVEVPAIPGLLLKGHLKSISQMAKPRNPGVPGSPKVYTGLVELDDHDERMISGMSTKVTLIGEVRDDVIAVPLEAVFSEDDDYYCFVEEQDSFVRRSIKLGVMNAFMVEVCEGLSEGETVCLVHPETSEVMAAND